MKITVANVHDELTIFGKLYNRAIDSKMEDIYFESLKWMDLGQFERICRDLKADTAVFPKIKDFVERYQYQEAAKPAKINACKGCRLGVITAVDKQGYEYAFACTCHAGTQHKNYPKWRDTLMYQGLRVI